MRDADGFRQVSSYVSELLAQVLADALSGVSASSFGGSFKEDKSFIIEVCRASLMVLRYPGGHHSYFWTCANIEAVHNALTAKYSQAHPYVYEILGYLASNYNEDYRCKVEGTKCYLSKLITQVCSIARYAMEKQYKSLSSSDIDEEPALRTILLMLLSPCEFISMHTEFELSKHMASFSNAHLELTLRSLKMKDSQDSASYTILHIMTCLISLACYARLPQYQELLVRADVFNILLSVIRKCVHSDIIISRVKYVPHMHFCFDISLCCWDNLCEWDGKDILLFYSLIALSNLIRYMKAACFNCKKVEGQLMSRPIDTEELIKSYHSIPSTMLSPGSRFYAFHSLSFLGQYGIPNKFGRKMEAAIAESDLADLELLLSDGQSIKVHKAILAVRCPRLLPGEISLSKCSVDCGKGNAEVLTKRNSQSFVRMSNSVESSLLRKIIKYVYTDHVEVHDSQVKPLKTLAKVCGLKSLQGLLDHEQPKWGSSCPSYSLLSSLEPGSHSFWDIILEAKSTETVTCLHPHCQISAAHMHLHKVILSISCDYLRALFKSGMHDSFANVIKVPVGWRALHKLVHWFYSGEFPGPSNDYESNAEAQLSELRACLELASLAEYWLLEEVGSKSLDVFVGCMKSAPESCIKILSYAAGLSQWKMVEAGVRSMAHRYPKLRDDGLLESIDVEIVEMLRAEYVNFSQDCRR